MDNEVGYLVGRATEQVRTSKEEDNRLVRIKEKCQWLAHHPCKGHDEAVEYCVSSGSKGALKRYSRNDEEGNLLQKAE